MSTMSNSPEPRSPAMHTDLRPCRIVAGDGLNTTRRRGEIMWRSGVCSGPFIGGWLSPSGLRVRDYTISPSQQQALLSHFKKAVLVQYTDGFHALAENRPWYAVTCCRCLNMEDFNSHFRNKLRKGLKNCTVCKVDAEYIAAHGYDAYMAAYERYKSTAAPDIPEREA